MTDPTIHRILLDTNELMNHVEQLNKPQRILAKQYWFEILSLQQQQPLSKRQQLRLMGFVRDIQRVFTPFSLGDLMYPINVVSKVDDATRETFAWGLPCSQQTKGDLINLFATFDVPLPSTAQDMSARELCYLLAVSWPADCLRGWTPIRVVGRGKEGIVYAVCMLNDCNAVAKMQPADSLQREARIQLAAAPLAPRVYDIFTCDTLYQAQTGMAPWEVMIMEQFDGTLHQLLTHQQLTQEHLDSLLMTLEALVRGLDSKGITHRDLHTKNVLFAAKGRLHLVASDFGYAYMETLGFHNRDVSIVDAYMPTSQNMYYDMAKLLLSIRYDTRNGELWFPRLTQLERDLVAVEMRQILAGTLES